MREIENAESPVPNTFRCLPVRHSTTPVFVPGILHLTTHLTPHLTTFACFIFLPHGRGRTIFFRWLGNLCRLSNYAPQTELPSYFTSMGKAKDNNFQLE